MIEIIKVVGDTLDIKTMQASEAAIVISNGLQEVQIPASKELVEAVIKLRVELSSVTEVVNKPKPTKIASVTPKIQEVEVDVSSEYDDEGTGVESA